MLITFPKLFFSQDRSSFHGLGSRSYHTEDIIISFSIKISKSYYAVQIMTDVV